MTDTLPTVAAQFCSDCGARLNRNARFCHACGAAVEGGAPRADGRSRGSASPMRWALPALALVAVAAMSLYQYMRRDPAAATAATPAPPRGMQAPDISAMTPEERADRLFNRVMQLSSQGKTDSAAFFAPMALGALEQLQPLDAHRRYDIGVVALVVGDTAAARAQSDTILAQRPTHLLGLSLAVGAAEGRGDNAAASRYRQRLLAAGTAERATGLREYTDHEPDILRALEAAKKP